MKKTVIFLLCLSLMLALAACGGAPAQESAPTEAPAAAPVQETAPEETAAPEQEAAPAPEAESEDASENDPAATVEQVLAMQGQSVDDLIEWLGEPLSREYSSSCLVDGGQDGQLVYEGFTVYTLVQPDGTETVYDCELN
ncbi:MAG: hypothetical protein IJK35_06620 [Oscillospiraceae bacterium]|nr:hypothetical protein [Oscillospiraceae bacterium]